MGTFALPTGFRFHPTDEEMISCYLKGKLNHGLKATEFEVIPEVGLYKCEPSDLSGPLRIFHPQVFARRVRTSVWIPVKVQLLGDRPKMKMVKAQARKGNAGKRGLADSTCMDKGKEKVGPSKQGRKPGKEIMQNLLHAYFVGTPGQVKGLVQRWERDLKTKVEENIPDEEMEPMVTDPGNTRGRLFLFKQSIHLYWTMKCLMENAIVVIQEVGGDPKEASILVDMHRDIQAIQLQLHHQNVRLGRMERQLQSMHQVDMPGSSVKDSTPIESSDE